MIDLLLDILPAAVWMGLGAMIYSTGFKRGQEHQRRLDAETSKKEW